MSGYTAQAVIKSDTFEVRNLRMVRNDGKVVASGSPSFFGVGGVQSQLHRFEKFFRRVTGRESRIGDDWPREQQPIQP